MVGGVDAERLPDDVTAAVEAVLPEPVAENGDAVVGAERSVIGAEPGAEQGRDRQRLEDLRLGQRGRHALGAFRAGQIDAARHERAHRREGAGTIAPVAQHGGRDRAHAEAAAEQL